MLSKRLSGSALYRIYLDTFREHDNAQLHVINVITSCNCVMPADAGHFHRPFYRQLSPICVSFLPIVPGTTGNHVPVDRLKKAFAPFAKWSRIVRIYYHTNSEGEGNVLITLRLPHCFHLHQARNIVMSRAFYGPDFPFPSLECRRGKKFAVIFRKYHLVPRKKTLLSLARYIPDTENVTNFDESENV